MLRNKARSKPFDFADIKRILIIKLRHHGDVLITSPMFSTLKKHYPHLEVDALVYEDTAAMLAHHPDISQLQLINRQWKKRPLGQQMRAEWQLLQTLKQRNYDLVMHMTDHWRGLFYCRLLQVPFAITQQHPRRNSRLWKHAFNFNYPVNFKKRHMVEKHLDALRHLGLQPDEEDKRMVAIAGDEAEQTVTKQLQSHQLSAQTYIHVHPTSRWLFKSWDIDKMAELINRLAAKGHKIIITAAPSEPEIAMINAIMAKITEPVINLSGQLSLLQLMSLIRQAKLLIGVDSVPMHIASATNTPCLALFGPSNELEWSPWKNPHTILASQHPCRPCDLAGCADGGKSECLSAINVESAITAAEALLL